MDWGRCPVVWVLVGENQMGGGCLGWILILLCGECTVLHRKSLQFVLKLRLVAILSVAHLSLVIGIHEN